MEKKPASRRRIQLLVRVVLVPARCVVESIGDVVHKFAHGVCNLLARRVGAICHLGQIMGKLASLVKAEDQCGAAVTVEC